MHRFAREQTCDYHLMNLILFHFRAHEVFIKTDTQPVTTNTSTGTVHYACLQESVSKIHTIELHIIPKECITCPHQI